MRLPSCAKERAGSLIQVASAERNPLTPELVPICETMPELKPFDVSTWFGVFLPTERRNALSVASMLTNGRAVVREIAILGPVALVAWLVSRVRDSVNMSANL